MTTPTPIEFEIQRHSQKPERIAADVVEIAGTPPSYVFRRKGEAVFDIFVHAIERVPKPIYPSTPHSSAAWKTFVKKQDAANQVRHLER